MLHINTRKCSKNINHFNHNIAFLGQFVLPVMDGKHRTLIEVRETLICKTDTKKFISHPSTRVKVKRNLFF